MGEETEIKAGVIEDLVDSGESDTEKSIGRLTKAGLITAGLGAAGYAGYRFYKSREKKKAVVAKNFKVKVAGGVVGGLLVMWKTVGFGWIKTLFCKLKSWFCCCIPGCRSKNRKQKKSTDASSSSEDASKDVSKEQSEDENNVMLYEGDGEIDASVFDLDLFEEGEEVPE